MEWWQILIILFVAGCIAEEIVGIIVKAYGVNANKVIHCRDCKFQHLYRTGSCPYFTTWGSTAPDDWYCADAKRKE